MDGRRILVVDADDEARAETERLLASRGYEACCARSAREAIQLLRRDRFACAVVDVRLEDSPGLAAIPLLREADPDVRFVVTSATADRETEAQARRLSIVYYHLKGFGPEELLQAVARAAGGADMAVKPVILVVDDDRDYQAAMRQILEGAGYRVVSAYTKEEGLSTLQETTPDLIILDIMMTRSTDGFHFLYEMKEKQGAKRPPVLSISIVSQETGYKFSPTADGDYFPADDFMSKPVDPAVLLSRVGALLSGQRPTRAG